MSYRHPVSKNMSNEEYLAMLERQNQQKRAQEVQSKDYEQKQRMLEREKGFNVYHSGANRDLPAQQVPGIISQKSRKENSQLRGARRQWRDPSKSNERQSLSRSPMNAFGQQHSNAAAYFNPFDLSNKNPGESFGDKTNPDALVNAFRQRDTSQDVLVGNNPGRAAANAQRKKWGQPGRQQIDFDRDDDDENQDDEDNYSDDFDEPAGDHDDPKQVYRDQHHLQSIEEKTNESIEHSQIHETSNVHIEQFLKTATAEEMDIIRESLSNFAEVSKNYTNFQSARRQQPDEDMIEEVFEEEIPEDKNESESDEEEHKFETVNKESDSKTTKKGRPVSAVYDLSKFKAGGQSGQQSQRTLGNNNKLPSSSQAQKQVPSTVKRDNQMKQQLEGSSHLFTGQTSRMSGYNTNKNEDQLTSQPSLAKLKTNQPFKPNLASSRPFVRPMSEINPGSREKRGKSPFQGSQFFNPDAGANPNYQTQGYVPIRDADNIDASMGGLSQVSQKDIELNQIMHAISALDDSQRQGLLAILRDKKLQSSLSHQNDYLKSGNQFEQQVQPPIGQSRSQATLGSLGKNQYFTADLNPSSKRNHIRIKVLSTHGDPHMCGLTEIEVFDSKAKKIVILPTNIEVRNQGGFGNTAISMTTKALVNGEKFTTEHRNMWIGHLPPPSQPQQHLEIVIWLPTDTEVSAIKIWNYNKSVRDSTKGVREIELYLNEELKFEGTIRMGRGQTRDDYSQLITFTDIKLEAEVPQEVSIKKTTVPVVRQSIQTSKDKSPAKATNFFDARNNRNKKVDEPKSRSRSPFEADGEKPLWLQGSSLAGSKSSRAFKAMVTEEATTGREKLNKRQNEQLSQQEGKQSQDRLANLFEVDAKTQALQKIFPDSQNPYSNNPTKRTTRIEESMDSLDFFKVTNLGRIKNENQKKPVQEAEIKRKRWGQEKPVDKPGRATEEVKDRRDSQISETSNSLSAKDSTAKSGFKAPRLMKSPFPEDFGTSPAFSQKKNNSKDKIFKYQDTLPIQPMLDLDDTFEIELKKLSQPTAIMKQQPKPLTQEEKFKQKLQEFELPFRVPDMPKGEKLEFNIIDTWGDANYLGMTGIEIFDGQGRPVQINGETDIKATPCDINLLLGYGNDPRTVDKLVDGNYFTNDDFHAWLTPFTQGDDHSISINLPAKSSISMIRIWNYNKSRIHSFRGARLITCHFDDSLIFRGEIQRAAGDTKDPSQCCEIILFTSDIEILRQIDNNDWLNDIQVQDDETQEGTDNAEPNRPMTATKRFTQEEVEQLQRGMRPTSMFDERPQTRAIRRNRSPVVQDEWAMDAQPNMALDDFKPKLIRKEKASKGVKGRLIEINILQSWGDLFYVGLNGIEVFDPNGNKIELSMSNLDAQPRDMNSIPGHKQDHRTLEKLINGVNNTSDDKNMWLIPFNEGEDHVIKIDLGRNSYVGSIRFWNYNKSVEDSLRGAKTVTIKIDGRFISSENGLTLRKAPGFTLGYDDLMRDDFGQTICLPFAEGWKPNMILPLQKQMTNSTTMVGLQQEYEPAALPMGLSFRINLYSTQSDHYYIGLNGIEFYDQLGNVIKIDVKEHVMANPVGINRIQGMESDVRTIDKLFNGVNQTQDERNMWLAPFKFTRSHAAANESSQTSDKREPNFISVMFDTPQALSAIRLWNYSKTQSRGVHEFEIVVDDKPIFRGFARPAPEQATSKDDGCTSVVFSSDPMIVKRFKQQVFYDPSKVQDILLINERKTVNSNVRERANEKFVFNEKERPTTKYGGGMF